MSHHDRIMNSLYVYMKIIRFSPDLSKGKITPNIHGVKCCFCYVQTTVVVRILPIYMHEDGTSGVATPGHTRAQAQVKCERARVKKKE